MILQEEFGIGCVLMQEVENQFEELTQSLQNNDQDLIVDCSNCQPNFPFLKKIKSHQENVNRCLVLLLPVNQQTEQLGEWNFVPTKTEALDFISFEQMQRDLGY
jgi:hypothetical protein